MIDPSKFVYSFPPPNRPRGQDFPLDSSTPTNGYYIIKLEVGVFNLFGYPRSFGPGNVDILATPTVSDESRIGPQPSIIVE